MDGIGHGEQKRDFVYIKDVTKVMAKLLEAQTPESSGVYNLGTGIARTFADLGNAVFSAMQRGEAKFEWIEMPAAVKEQYQYFTEADLDRLRSIAKIDHAFVSLEDGVRDYVSNYLQNEDPYL